jgi:hypothetical protein
MKFLYIILIPFVLYAQSEIITDSRFAVKADLIYSTNNNFSGTGGNMGFSFFNSADIGFEYLKGSYNPEYNMESSATTFYAAYNFRIKNNCIRLLAGYAQNTVDYYSSTLNISGTILSLVLYNKIYENESLILIPGAGFSIGFLSVSNGSKYNDYSKMENPKSAGLDFNVVSKINNKFYLVIDPSLSKDLVNQDNSLIIGISLGLLFRVPNQ